MSAAAREVPRFLAIIAQYLICLPIVIYLPFSFGFLLSAFLPHTYADLFDHLSPGRLLFPAFVLSPLSIIALFVSICVSGKDARYHRKSRAVLTLLLLAGCMISISFISAALSQDRGAKTPFLSVWAFGGPLVVALVTLGRWYIRANKASEPTAMSVTTPAAQDSRRP